VSASSQFPQPRQRPDPDHRAAYHHAGAESDRVVVAKWLGPSRIVQKRIELADHRGVIASFARSGKQFRLTCARLQRGAKQWIAALRTRKPPFLAARSPRILGQHRKGWLLAQNAPARRHNPGALGAIALAIDDRFAGRRQNHGAKDQARQPKHRECCGSARSFRVLQRRELGLSKRIRGDRRIGLNETTQIKAGFWPRPRKSSSN